MDQKEFRAFDDKVYTPVEAEAIVLELLKRTSSDEVGFNSIGELAVVVKALVNGHASKVYLTLAEMTADYHVDKVGVQGVISPLTGGVHGNNIYAFTNDHVTYPDKVLFVKEILEGTDDIDNVTGNLITAEAVKNYLEFQKVYDIQEVSHSVIENRYLISDGSISSENVAYEILVFPVVLGSYRKVTGTIAGNSVLFYGYYEDALCTQLIDRGVVNTSGNNSFSEKTKTPSGANYLAVTVLKLVNDTVVYSSNKTASDLAEQNKTALNQEVQERTNADATEKTNREAAVANLQSQVTSILSILNSNDLELDTAQERIDFIKNIASELDGLQISDIQGLNAELDSIKANLLGNSVYKFLNQNSIAVTRMLMATNDLTTVGNFTNGVTDTITSDVFSNSNFGIEENAKSYKLEGWRASSYSAYAGFENVLNYDISNATVGDVVRVSFILKRNGLGNTDNSVATRSLIIGENLIPLTIANAETSETDLGNGYYKYDTAHALTASDITEGTIDAIKLVYYASSNNSSDSLEVLGCEIYISNENLYSETFSNKIDDLNAKIVVLNSLVNQNTSEIAGLENTTPVATSVEYNGEIISNSIVGMEFFGNYTPPFTSQYISTAKQESLSFLDENTPVYVGVGFKTAAAYGSHAGQKINLSSHSLSNYNANEGDVLNLLFYTKKIDAGTHPEQGFSIGSNHYEVHEGTDVTITDMGEGWNKYEVTHTLTVSDISENQLGDFVIKAWNSTNETTILTQSIKVVEPLIWLNDIDIDDTLDTVSRKLINTKLELFETSKKRWRNKKWTHRGDSISAYLKMQPVVRDLLDVAEWTDISVPGRAMRDCFADDVAGSLVDKNLLTIALCTNDYLGSRPLGNVGDTKESGTFAGDVYENIRLAFADNPNLQLAFFSCFKLNPSAEQPFGDEIDPPNSLGHTPRDYVDMLISVCSSYSIPVLDLHKNGVINGYNIDVHTSDKIHPLEKFLKEIYALIVSRFLEDMRM